VIAQGGSESLAVDCVDAVRSLAHKFEELGIEVNHLPGITLDHPTWSSSE
jgi:hypothetical protein